MARRFSRGIEYGRARFHWGWTVVTLPSLTEKLQGWPLFLLAKQSLQMRSAVPFGRRILRRRDKIKKLEADNDQDRRALEKFFGPGGWREHGVVGVVSHRGQKPFRVLVSERTGYQVTDNQSLIEWLGKDAEEVLTGAKVNPASLTDEPQDLLELLQFIKERFPDRFDSIVELEFSTKKLDKVVEDRDEEPPDGVIDEKKPSYTVLVEYKH